MNRWGRWHRFCSRPIHVLPFVFIPLPANSDLHYLMCHRIRADKNNNCGQRQSRRHTSGCGKIIHITVYISFHSYLMRYQWLVDASAEMYLYVWWQSASSVQRGHPPRRRGLWPHHWVRVSCWFSDEETGPDKASHQMSSGWEIGFDAVPFTISWPSLWHIDGIYVSLSLTVVLT